MKENYQRQLDGIIEGHQRAGEIPSLFLHSCCGPCSSYVLEYLTKYFDLGVLYYNPNISPAGEYEKRVNELERLINEMPLEHEVKLIKGRYEPREFFDAVKGYEECPEGGERCFICYELRMREVAQLAKELGYDYFTTTLTISPLKNAAKINEIGQRLENEY